MHANKSTKEKKKTDLAEYMPKVIIRLNEEKKYAARRTYTSTLHSFTEFSEEKGVSILAQDVFVPGRLKEYEVWLRGRELSWNTVSTYMRTLQAVYHRLYPSGSLGHNPNLFDGVYTKVESQTKRALTEEQMKTLTEAAFRILPEKKPVKKKAKTATQETPQFIAERTTEEMPQNGQEREKTKGQKNKTEKMEIQQTQVQEEGPQSRQALQPVPVPENLHRALAYFLLMFLLRGMPFIDLAHLRKSDMKGNTLMYHRHKTGRQMTVQIPPEAVRFLEAYRDKSDASPYLFPVLDGTLTDDAALYNDYLSALRRFNSDLGELAEMLFSGTVKISSYTARHTWATLMFHMGVPVGIICEALGHSSIRVTETYLKPFGNEKVDKANKKLIGSIMKTNERHSFMYSSL